MKKMVILLLSIYSAAVVFSQDYGIQWVQGDVPVTIMDFRDDTIKFEHLSDTIEFFIGTANICDYDGNFLFFSSGKTVRDRDGKVLDDSLSFDPSIYNFPGNDYCCSEHESPNEQDVLFLPKPGSDHLYYLFHYNVQDTSYWAENQIQIITSPLNLFYTVLDADANFGLGAVVQKNIKLPIHRVMSSSQMTACKHANGRDWWVIRQGERDSLYIKFLVTPDSVLGPYYQYIGAAHTYQRMSENFYGTAVFSESGDKFASSTQIGPIVVMDFDRCNGEFSNPITIINLHEDTTWPGAMGLALSPNGRFLYASSRLSLNQYDLANTANSDSVRLYTVVDSIDPYTTRTLRLGPNGKIYMATYHGGSQHLHVINEPDNYGMACNFVFNGQQCLTYNTWNLPNMVNYKLGALAGSGCDTISGTPKSPKGDLNSQIQVSPNPARDYFFVETEMRDALLSVSDVEGRLVQKAEIRNQKTEIRCSGWARGVYFVMVRNKEGEKRVKVVVE